MRLVIVSGLSGAGKSVAMRALEDLGYYCVDNLPLGLMPALAEQLQSTAPVHRDDVAVAIDARNFGADFGEFPAIIAGLEARGVTCEVVYLEADDEVLTNRFSETRRKHPLTADAISLGDALDRERILLAPVRERADICLDTTNTHLYQLRDLVRQRVDQRPQRPLNLLFESFGFKFGVPPDADIMFDARCLPNPHWEPGLRELTGKDAAVAQFLADQPLVEKLADDITDFLDRWVPAFESDNRTYLTVAIGCTGGRHRSVYLVERLGQHFRTARSGVIVRHREVG